MFGLLDQTVDPVDILLLGGSLVHLKPLGDLDENLFGQDVIKDWRSMDSNTDDSQIAQFWRHLYHTLLNQNFGEALEPLALLDYFSERFLLLQDEKLSVENEPSLTRRQFLFFLRIAPSKGRDAFDALMYYFTRVADLLDVANFLLSSLEKRPIADERKDDETELVCLKSIDLATPAPGPHRVADLVDGAAVKRRKRSLEYWPPPPKIDNEAGVRAIVEQAKVYKIEANELSNEATPVCLGRGGYSDVYGMIYNKRRVAVKKFRVYDEFSLKMFFEEVEIMRQLNHPNIMQFIGYVHDDDKRILWMVSEYVEGGTLERFCSPPKSGAQKLNLDRKVAISISCWDGLDYLHNLRLCHKDIHPGNVLISDDLNIVKISDFGLSEFKFVTAAYLTQKISGQYMYYPPEFASKQGYLRHATLSDVYSMGAVLCELFSEKPFWHFAKSGLPYSLQNVMFILVDQLTSPRDPESLCLVTKDIRDILKLAIDPDYSKRPSAHELLEKFQALS